MPGLSWSTASRRQAGPFPSYSNVPVTIETATSGSSSLQPTRSPLSVKPQPPPQDMDVSSGSVIYINDSLNDSEHQEPANRAASEKVTLTEDVSPDTERTDAPVDSSSGTDRTVVPEDKQSIEEEEVDELLASEPGSPHRRRR